MFEVCLILLTVLGIWVHVRLIDEDRNARITAWVQRAFDTIKNASFRIPERSAAAMLWIARKVYGTHPVRQILVSFFLSACYTGLVLWASWVLTPDFDQARADKALLEREADKWLYAQDAAEMERAFETEIVVYMVQRYEPGGRTVTEPQYREEYKNFDELSVKIRRHAGEFLNRFAEVMSGHPNQELIALLTLLEGTYLDPGLQALPIASFVVLNALADFVSFLSVYWLLRLLIRSYSIWRFTAVLSAAALIGMLLFMLVLLSYGRVAEGRLYFLYALWLQVPGGVLLIGGAVCAPIVVYMHRQSLDLAEVILSIIGTIAAFAFGVWLIKHALPQFEGWGFPDLYVPNGVNWIPYLFAISTIIPVAGYLTVMALALLAKTFETVLREVALYYLSLVCRLGTPLVILLTSTPLAVYEFLDKVWSLVSSPDH